jgi:glycosyltransferase involved in cell wall biosynthesis
MLIGIDGHVLGKNIGGVERFVRELVLRLPSISPENDYIIFVSKNEFQKLKSKRPFENCRFVQMPLTSNLLVQRLILLPLLVRIYRLDALLVQRLSPWFCGSCKLIATIHDLTPIKFSHKYKGLSNTLVRILTKNTIKRSHLILTPTNSIKKEIQEYCKTFKAEIVPFYNGVDPHLFSGDELKSPPKSLNQQAYVLTVGAIEQRKNIETIIDAIDILGDQIQFVIVGSVRDKEYSASLIKKIEDLNLNNRVNFFGFVDEAELIRFYKHASVFISASKDEGFNIPVIEAMACETPTVSSDIAVHKELFFDATLFYKVDSAEDLADKIDQIISQRIDIPKLVSNGLKKVTAYSWENTAKNVARALRLLNG